MGENSAATPLLVLVHLAISLLTLIIFLILIAVICATVIPQLYEIDEGTDRIIHVESGTDRIPYVEKGIALLHEDLKVMIGQLDLAAAVLLSIDKNIASLCNGGTCSAFVILTADDAEADAAADETTDA